MNIVKSIIPGSPADGTLIAVGDVLRRVNGEVISDILDYDYFIYDSSLLLEFTSSAGRIKLINIYKPEGLDIGLVFESYLMDSEHHCNNNCIFCFIDQLPVGLRESLYYKDDDVRLSFLQGNYVTLTNLSLKDVERIIRLRISPINVSVHSLDSEIRSYILGTKRAAFGLRALNKLANAGIVLNCQIVCCSGVNDGWLLSKTLEGFIKLGSSVNSVSIVPVGLTKYRDGLTKLKPFDKALALQTIRQVEFYAEKCMKSRGSRVFFCADELYMLAGLELPENDFYEDYPQLENGVGMMRLFITEFEEALSKHLRIRTQNSDRYSVVTGVLAYPYIKKLIETFTEKCGTIICNVYAIRNDFFGESVTVSGLVTGGDIIAQLKGKELGSKLIISKNMLRDLGETPLTPENSVFLDDVTVAELSKTLGVPIQIVKPSAAELLNAISEFCKP
ncbi:MAG: DUF512 domain-containing protein [Oscillospiraceae bacterium]|jgi:putative radical SAM enzyme (TIGR03279 family)|nr:DUF512 domain-containing protein [Oscillospiraceae bacterium]